MIQKCGKKIYAVKGSCLLLSTFLTLILQTCTPNSSQLQKAGKYYEENYPKQAHNSNYSGNRSFWKNSVDEPPLNMHIVQEPTLEGSVDNRHDNNVRAALIREEKLTPPDHKFAAEDDLSSQNTSSMIEGKIYNLAEDAYKRRDYDEFIKLYALFVESFPHSSQKGFLDEKKQSFFYQEDLRIEKLQGAMLEVAYPNAKSLQELGLYFERLRDKGIDSIQINVVQFMGTPVFLFAKSNRGEGYFFANSSDLSVDNILVPITKMAHDNGLKVFASFPLRHHPHLGNKAVFLLDESWNMLQNRTMPNSKLDLLNPNSRDYLYTLIQDLLKVDIDGIVFKDDFTYELNEGFSDIARERYLTATGQPLLFNKMFVPIYSNNSLSYEILTSDEFNDIVQWRTREITQLLWDLIAFIKRQCSGFRVGIEVTPEMVLERFTPTKWYSTGLPFLKDLKVDFFILKWQRYDSFLEADPEDYALAVERMRKAVSNKKEIFLKIPLTQMTKNTIELNRRIDSHSDFQNEYPGIKIAVGPVDRIERLDIVN
jgi:hypothetical protein